MILRLLLTLALAGSLMASGADQTAPGTSAERQCCLTTAESSRFSTTGKHWEVEAWPFDATNAPKTFSGYGTPKPYTCD